MVAAKVVIVEDNPVTLRSLIQTIDWQALNCEIAGYASDGESGRELILSVRPDLLLADIFMPQIDGLQMLEEVRQELPDMKVIIITGYERFQYASRAIKLSVFDYILKPIRNEELIQSVQRALKEAREKRETLSVRRQADRLLRQAQMLSLLTNFSRVGLNVHQMLDNAQLYAKAYYFIIVQPENVHAFPSSVLEGVDGLLTDWQSRTLSIILYDSLVLYVMCEDGGDGWRREATEIATRIADALPERVCIGISALATSQHQIRKTYQQARQALWENTMNQEESVCGFYSQEEPMGDSAMAKMQQQMSQLIETADLSDESAQEAARVIVRLSGQQYSHLRALVSLYVLLLSKKFPPSSNGDVDKALNDAWYVTGETEVSRCLQALSAMLRRENREKSDQCSLLTKNVLEYIRLHGAESLKLNDVADHFQVSANYLSALISRETGVLFHNHVLRAKMDIAHTLLADPRIRVEEVAHAVGYSNYVSFYNVFKRLEHMTPTQYRERLAKQ